MLHFDINKNKPLSSLYTKKSSLTKVLFLAWLTTIIALIFIFITFSFYFKINDFKETSISLNKAHNKSYNKILKANVESTIRILDYIYSSDSSKTPDQVSGIEKRRAEVLAQYLKLNPLHPQEGNIYIISTDKKMLLNLNSTEIDGKTIDFKNKDGQDLSDSAIRAANAPKGNSFTYYRNIGNSGEKEKNYCFMKAIKELDVIVCSEIPQESLDSAVAMNLERLKINLYIEIGFVAIIFAAVIILTVFYIYRLSNSIKSELNTIITFLENDRDKEIISSFSPDNFQFREFAIIGDSARSMVEKIKKLFDWLGKKALEAETANQEKTSLLSGITDDFQPELNTVTLMSQSLLDSSLSSREKEKIHKINNAASNITSILKNIESTFLFDNPKFSIKQEDINIKKIAHEAFTLIEPKAKEKKISVKYEIDEGIPENCIGDSLRIRQLLINIFENVVSSAKKGPIDLTLKVNQLENQLQLNFVAENKEEVFSEAELNEILNYPNTKPEFALIGLRVAACDNITKKLKGNFQIISTEEKGTTYTLELPLDKMAEKDSQ